jgi:hypothetical protein
VDGQIDGWAARPGAFFGPAMGLGLSLLMKFLPYIDPRRRSYEKAGFVQEGVFRDMELLDGAYRDVVFMAKLAEN